MSSRVRLAMAALVLMGVAPRASADLVLDPLTGAGALQAQFDTDPFSPNRTSPQLQLTGEGAVENTGGCAVFSDEIFTLDIQFLAAYDNERKRSFEDLVITAAFQPGGAAFEKLRFFDPTDPSHHTDILLGSFVDSTVFGLPFPPDDTIRGMANGEADYLSLNGALMAGVDLGVGLERDRHATLPPTVNVGVQVFVPDPESKIRFDVFGLKHRSPWVVYGNNPNSGSGGLTTDGNGGGVVPEPVSAVVFGAGLACLHFVRRRRHRKPSLSR